MIAPTDRQSPPAPSANARALWYIAPGRSELRDEPLANGGRPGPEDALVETLYSAISRGTESLVAAGRVPPAEWERMRAPFQSGSFAFPVKYGYSAVGRVIDGPAEWRGRLVHALAPHQDRWILPCAALQPLPVGVPPRRGTLAANLETAVNALWDAAPGPGDRIAFVGAGVVGGLLAAVLGRMPGVEVTLVDVDPDRATLAARLGVGFARPEAAVGDCDCVFHASGHPAGTQTALDLAGVEAGVYELSWFGDQPSALRLGAAFHSRRLRLVSSQVGRIPAHRQARTDFARRRAIALSLLTDARMDALLGATCPFDHLPDRIAGLLAASDGRAPVIVYPAAERP